METLRSRDQSGVYRLADQGKIAQMPGVSATFEEPQSPDLVLQTDQLDVEKCVDQIIHEMKVKGFIS
jgi:adenylylsulfate kinase-like enzyme